MRVLFGFATLALACSDNAVHGRSKPLDATTDVEPRGEESPPLDAPEGPYDAGAIGEEPNAALPDPVLFVHGANGSEHDWDTLRRRLVEMGWPTSHLAAHTFPDPRYGCNRDNAHLVKTWAMDLMTNTGASRIDLVAHSMGSLSSRTFVKSLGGSAFVNTFVLLGAMNHGLVPPCFSPLPVCVWQELCASGPFIAGLNAPPACVPGVRYVSIFGGLDSTVPNASSALDCAENILVPGVEHAGGAGLQESPVVAEEVARILR